MDNNTCIINLAIVIIVLLGIFIYIVLQEQFKHEENMLKLKNEHEKDMEQIKHKYELEWFEKKNDLKEKIEQATEDKNIEIKKLNLELGIRDDDKKRLNEGLEWYKNTLKEVHNFKIDDQPK